jgi:hypothetical protein
MAELPDTAFRMNLNGLRGWHCESAAGDRPDRAKVNLELHLVVSDADVVTIEAEFINEDGVHHTGTIYLPLSVAGDIAFFIGHLQAVVAALPVESD